MKRIKTYFRAVLLTTIIFTSYVRAGMLAFPGAQGFVCFARGGRGGFGRGGGAGSVEAPPVVQGINPDSVIDISQNMNENGQLNWNAPSGNWVVIRFGYTSCTNRNVAASESGS